MHIETSLPRRRGDKARLTSPMYRPVRGGQCFQFWYHMYGNDIDTLNVYVKTGSSISIPVWSRSGNRGDLWKISQVPLTATVNFNVGVIMMMMMMIIIITSTTTKLLFFFKNIFIFYSTVHLMKTIHTGLRYNNTSLWL